MYNTEICLSAEGNKKKSTTFFYYAFLSTEPHKIDGMERNVEYYIHFVYNFQLSRREEKKMLKNSIFLRVLPGNMDFGFDIFLYKCLYNLTY